ncbi:hypothetical protein D1007_12267 [Hordeum vulgare]|nr:hypothetical protein D1007_12267 [Hordeum vulgare]
MAAAGAYAEEEAIREHIVKKRHRRNTHVLDREQNRVVCKMVELSPKEEKEDTNNEDNSDDEQKRLNPYRVFNRYFSEKDNNGVGKGKGSLRWFSPSQPNMSNFW